MNNWRLLLLAVVAVFQPIASFTDSNLIDGRQQCCDRLSSAPLQDTRSSLQGTYRLGKTTSALQRLNDRDETREDQRYELSRPSSERPLVGVRGRVARQSPSELARSSRVEFRLERPATSPSRERLLDVNQREETARSTRDLQAQDLTRRIVDRTSRDALERRNVRIYTESPRDNLFRNDYRIERFGNERLSKNLFDSQREMQREQLRSIERRITLNRDARRVLSRTQDDVTSVEAPNNMNNQRIARERLSAVRRESTIRPDTRRNSERNDERRDLQRNNEQRRSLTENTRLVDRIRDMRIRLNAREDNRENRQRDSSNQRLSTERFEGRREHRGDRSYKQQNKENIDRSASGERRMKVARRITRKSRIINVMDGQNDRNADVRPEIIHNEKISREIKDEIRENPTLNRISSERILMDRRNIRESGIMNAQNKRDNDSQRDLRQTERLSTRKEIKDNLQQRLSSDRIQMDRRNVRESRMINVQIKREVDDSRREIRHNERLTRETRNENMKNLEETLSRERLQMYRRNVRESRIVNGQNTRDVADRRQIRQNERLTRETRDENRENREETHNRERIKMDRRNIRESRMMNAQNKMEVDGRREIRQIERLTRETRDENREEGLSRGRIQMDRRNIRESRMINAQNKREVDGRREIRHSERLTIDTWDENREVGLSRERIQMDRRNIRESRMMNAQNTRDVADRRAIRHSESNTRDERENHINRFSVERSQVDRSNTREFRVINNLITRDDDRRMNSKRETRLNNRMSRKTRDENSVNPDHRLSFERIQMERRNIREFRTVSTPNDKEIDSRREIRFNERSTGLRQEARLNSEQRISRKRIQMDRRTIREFRNMNIVIRTERDAESRREMRTDARLHLENRENRKHRLSRESIPMDRRNNRESRIRNTLRVRDLDSRQEISYNERLTRETGDELRENPDRRLARESRQVDRRNIRESRVVNRVATRNERSTDTENRREIRKNERLSELRDDQFTPERRVQSRSADRVNAEERDSAIMDRSARSADRRNFREIRAKPILSRSTDSERRSEVFRSRAEHSHKIENKEREAIDASSRNVEMSRNRERISSVMVGKMETENDYTIANWQYVLYTLQAAYLCALFMQMLTPSRTKKANQMSLRWLPVSSHYNPIKVD